MSSDYDEPADEGGVSGEPPADQTPRRGRRIGSLLGRFWRWWSALLDKLPAWMFAPDPEPLQPPDPENASDVEMQEFHERLNQIKGMHDENSKTVRRVFHTLAGTCLFCVVTLAGSPDSQLLTSEATVTLPILNFEMSFIAFLVVGPVLLIVLTVYLHIFVNHHRRFKISDAVTQPMLPNFGNVSAKVATWLLFYWMVPITLAVFAWKSWPRPVAGISLLAGTLGLVVILGFLQARRCPKSWRRWAFPSLVLSFCLSLIISFEGSFRGRSQRKGFTRY
jgi:hypothetical protein